MCGPLIQDFPKITAGRRTIALPGWVIDLLDRRRQQLVPLGDAVVFPSPNGRLRDPHNTSHDLRTVLDRAGFAWVTSHVFRKTVATRLDEAGLSARQIADHLGRTHPSLTQDVYMGRGLANPEAAAALDRPLTHRERTPASPRGPLPSSAAGFVGRMLVAQLAGPGWSAV